jgi:hypothetical protein
VSKLSVEITVWMMIIVIVLGVVVCVSWAARKTARITIKESETVENVNIEDYHNDIRKLEEQIITLTRRLDKYEYGLQEDNE